MEAEPIIVDRDAVVRVMQAYGWEAEWGPGRYRGDPILMLHWGEMAVSNHPTLDLSIHGVSGTYGSVDLVTTLVADVPASVASFAAQNLAEVLQYASRALAEVLRLPSKLAEPDMADGSVIP